MAAAQHPADMHDMIRVQGARENNLRDVSLDIPKRRLTVFTGVSGSGKSSLVFATIAAESQRMINETYSAFVQGFMPSLARPDVDVLEGLTTAIIVDQERMGANSRSTVGTATDANALLRVLFSRLGDPQIGPPNAFSFNVPTTRVSGERTSSTGETVTIENEIYLGGMCPRCEGMGAVNDIDLAELYEASTAINDGAITVPGYTADGWMVRIFTESGFVDGTLPIRDFSPEMLQDFLYKEPTKVKVSGINMTYEGLVPRIQKSMLSKDVDAMQPHIRAFVERAVTFTACPECEGTRLSEAARSSRIDGVSIAEACAMQISDLAIWVRAIDAPGVGPLLTTLQGALDSFVEIGLGYLSLNRPVGTLSGGEAQRTKMIRHLGSSLTDVTYVFDEPTVGLHPHDIQRMNELLKRLRDKGNTVLVVEHKPEAIAIADHVVDLGPRAGTAGGEIVFEGTVAQLRGSGTLTGRHLDDRVTLKTTVRTPSGAIEVRGASSHNLEAVDVDVPSASSLSSPASRARARARSSTARSPEGTEWSPSTRAPSAARGAAIRLPTRACSSRSARHSRRPTASSRRCSARTRRARARPARALASSTPISGCSPRCRHRAKTAAAGASRRPFSSTGWAQPPSPTCSRCP